jgi:hypothetical protein
MMTDISISYYTLDWLSFYDYARPNDLASDAYVSSAATDEALDTYERSHVIGVPCNTIFEVLGDASKARAIQNRRQAIHDALVAKLRNGLQLFTNEKDDTVAQPFDLVLREAILHEANLETHWTNVVKVLTDATNYLSEGEKSRQWGRANALIQTLSGRINKKLTLFATPVSGGSPSGGGGTPSQTSQLETDLRKIYTITTAPNLASIALTNFKNDVELYLVQGVLYVRIRDQLYAYPVAMSAQSFSVYMDDCAAKDAMLKSDQDTISDLTTQLTAKKKEVAAFANNGLRNLSRYMQQKLLVPKAKADEVIKTALDPAKQAGFNATFGITGQIRTLPTDSRGDTPDIISQAIKENILGIDNVVRSSVNGL